MLAALIATIMLTGSTAGCDISADERAALLALPYQEFDQTQEAGWRHYGEEAECYGEAEMLLADYILFARTPLLELKNIRVLRWHAGQMSALAGDESRALDYFQATYEPTEDRTDYLDWNAYVDASIAFLTKDRELLLQSRKRLTKQTPFSNDAYPNLNVVDGFVKCFDKTYREAYSPTCQSDGKTP